MLEHNVSQQSAQSTPTRLQRYLLESAERHAYDSNDESKAHLLQEVYLSLLNYDENNWKYFLKGQPQSITSSFSLSSSQRAEPEYFDELQNKGTGSEVCGHVFRDGEVIYRCKTCGSDSTCVLCAPCFRSTNHEGHETHVSISTSFSGVCDCGDPEAWKVDLPCKIHSHSETKDDSSPEKCIPAELQKSISETVRIVLDFVLDVFSCSSINLKAQQSVESVLADEEASRLSTAKYGSVDKSCDVFRVMLWNDEFNTFEGVVHCVQRAVNTASESFGLQVAQRVDSIGRFSIKTSTSIQELLRIARIISSNNLAVNVRSARDFFREDDCSTLLHWLEDLLDSHVCYFPNYIQTVFCNEMLKQWSPGLEKPTDPSLNFSNLPMEIANDDDSEDEFYAAEELLGVIANLENNNLPTDITDMETEDNDGEAETAGIDFNRATGAENDDDENAITMDSEAERELLHDLDDENAIDSPMNDVNDEQDEEGEEEEEEEEEEENTTVQENNVTHGNTEQATPEQATTPLPPPPNTAQTVVTIRPEFNPQLLNNLRQIITARRRPRPNMAFQVPLQNSYWQKPPTYKPSNFKDVAESPYLSLRLDYLLVFDLKFWKELRTLLSRLYVVPFNRNLAFKRLMGIRFAIHYKHLASAFVLADREPDRSVMFLSVQFFTTPSIAEAVVKDYDLLTDINSAAVSLLVQPSAGETEGVQKIKLNDQVLKSRRTFNLFHDLKYLLQVPQVKNLVTKDSRYIHQWIDLLRVFQGNSPQKRATHSHVQWDVTRLKNIFLMHRLSELSEQVASCYETASSNDLLQAVQVLVIAITQPKDDVSDPREPLECVPDDPSDSFNSRFPLKPFSVSVDPISLNHPLHWALATVLSYCDSDVLGSFDQETFFALIDHPLRVIAFLMQVDANLWVRNGHNLLLTTRFYRQLYVYLQEFREPFPGNREYTFDKDILLIQRVLSQVNPDVGMKAILQRIEFTDWVFDRKFNEHEHYDSEKIPRLLGSLLKFMITLTTERESLLRMSIQDTIRVRLAHELCFGPLAYSALLYKISGNLVEDSSFDSIREEMTNYKPPDGLHDFGLYTLKDEYFDLINPYSSYYSKNEREEAEAVLKKRLSDKKNIPLEAAVIEPNFKLVEKNGQDIFFALVNSDVFYLTLLRSLEYALLISAKQENVDVSETIINEVLQLCLISSRINDFTGSTAFYTKCCHEKQSVSPDGEDTGPSSCCLAELCFKVINSSKLKSLHAKANHFLSSLKKSDSTACASILQHTQINSADLGSEEPAIDEAKRVEEKKRIALEKQKNIMQQFRAQQASFMAQNSDFNMDDEDEYGEYTYRPPFKQHEHLRGNCLLCQESCNEEAAYGMLGTIKKSKFLRDTADTKQVLRELFVIPSNFNAQVLDRPFGEKTEKVALDETKSRILGAYPVNHNIEGLYVSSCGHLMHTQCFNTYTSSRLLRRSDPSTYINDKHKTTPATRYFMCPLCGYLSNVIIPTTHTPRLCLRLNDFGIHKNLEAFLSSFTIENNESFEFCMANTEKDVAKKVAENCLSRPWINTNQSAVIQKEENRMDDNQDAIQRYFSVMEFSASKLSDDNLSKGSLPDELLDSLCYSLASLEVIYRGTPSSQSHEAPVWISNIGSINSAFLLSFAEAVMKSLCHKVNSSDDATSDLIKTQNRQLGKLFYGKSDIQEFLLKNQNTLEAGSFKPLLSSDVFNEFVRTVSLMIIYEKQGHISYYSELYYIANICKIVVETACYVEQTETFAEPSIKYSDAAKNAFCQFCGHVFRACGIEEKCHILESEATLLKLLTLVEKFMLPFLRRVSLVHYSLFNIYFEKSIDETFYEKTELTQLCELMELPMVDEVYTRLGSQQCSEQLQLINGWCQHYAENDTKVNKPRLEYPGIYELLKLPSRLESLMDIMQESICCMCHKTPILPAVCLQCGSVVCFSARQTTTAAQRQPGEYGISGAGMVVPAPYLDIHGETDFRLIRGCPQFLSQKRYDHAVRNAWLRQMVLSSITRSGDSGSLQVYDMA
ncbi:N-end-recognizing protein [Schizosaccharomyces cryophilus OY26]|uniref:E3 ubiquitin-protein ligase n=1 Tax=Schizosaccharomyces cryophilus (strain OY26 / ATCC MYA-4695 / CBS 11777 / NBRC 106824 / NRRL Y48691) TaxID=653667 RepID=S9W375_SCHCR|nr:N-end-recognizing protein [Schizosaccharomyces cryophilus OY26]EPY53009.1 N-end-recognizing protein [Schizosaccharomyces cryophilus OY26]